MHNSIDISRFENFQKVMGMDSYIVKKGDTLWNIAKNFGIPVEQLISINQLASDVIYPNQVLFVPQKNNIYYTKEGDTLAAIGKLYKLDFSSLGEFSEILNLELAPNQAIHFENRKRNSNVVYNGEGIRQFLDKHNISAERFMELNQNNILKPGSRVNVR